MFFVFSPVTGMSQGVCSSVFCFSFRHVVFTLRSSCYLRGGKAGETGRGQDRLSCMVRLDTRIGCVARDICHIFLVKP